MKKELISVIVPIYNVEKYLKNCIESIINQTYKELEIILVDDGAEDNCPKMCDEYAKKDDRIIVIHKKNGGLSDARNKGLNKATGTYIYFVDSDDYIHPKCLETMYINLINNKVDVATCNVKSVPSNYNDYLEVDNIDFDIIEGYKIIDRLKNSDEVNIGKVVWNKLYPKKYFNDIQFPIGMIHEDEAIIYQLMYKASKIVHIKNCLHYYRRSEESIMRSKFTEKRLDIIKSLKIRTDFFENIDKRIYELSSKEYYKQLLYNEYLAKKFLNISKDYQNYIKKEKNRIFSTIKHKGMELYLLNYFSFLCVRYYYLKNIINNKLKKWKKGYLK